MTSLSTSPDQARHECLGGVVFRGPVLLPWRTVREDGGLPLTLAVVLTVVACERLGTPRLTHTYRWPSEACTFTHWQAVRAQPTSRQLPRRASRSALARWDTIQ